MHGIMWSCGRLGQQEVVCYLLTGTGRSIAVPSLRLARTCSDAKLWIDMSRMA
jgi:hypothetical protein